MYALSVGEGERVRALLEPLSYCLVIDSILSGQTPATIYVDNVSAPETVVTWFKSRVLLGGSSTNQATNHAVRDLLVQTYCRQAQESGWQAFSLYTTPGWEEQLDVILKGYAPTTAHRHYYRLDACRRDWEVVVPAGFDLRPVDSVLLTHTRIQNLEFVMEEMVAERPSIADFLDKSFGYCLLWGDEIVAWCMSEYNIDYRCELGIATVEAFRRRGLATVAASAVISEALRRGIYYIGWLCWAHNRPSVAIALKLGFTLLADFPVYLFDL